VPAIAPVEVFLTLFFPFFFFPFSFSFSFLFFFFSCGSLAEQNKSDLFQRIAVCTAYMWIYLMRIGGRLQVGLIPRFVLIKTIDERKNKSKKKTSQKGVQKLITSRGLTDRRSRVPQQLVGSPSRLRLVGIARVGLQLEVGGAMGDAHGAVGWAPDEVLLEQTLEVLRASQSHSNETQADVQQVGAPAHTSTHTHACTRMPVPLHVTPTDSANTPMHRVTLLFTFLVLSSVRCWASECDVACGGVHATAKRVSCATLCAVSSDTTTTSPTTITATPKHTPQPPPSTIKHHNHNFNHNHSFYQHQCQQHAPTHAFSTCLHR
jgi:hypothetical protein